MADMVYVTRSELIRIIDFITSTEIYDDEENGRVSAIAFYPSGETASDGTPIYESRLTEEELATFRQGDEDDEDDSGGCGGAPIVGYVNIENLQIHLGG